MQVHLGHGGQAHPLPGAVLPDLLLIGKEVVSPLTTLKEQIKKTISVILWSLKEARHHDLLFFLRVTDIAALWKLRMDTRTNTRVCKVPNNGVWPRKRLWFCFVLFYNSKFHGRILTYLYKSLKSEETQDKLLLL